MTRQMYVQEWIQGEMESFAISETFPDFEGQEIEPALIAKVFVNEDPSFTQHEAETLAHNTAKMFAASPKMRDALVKAHAFIRGFEDDESQEGIGDLLLEIRSAIPF